MNTHHDIDGLCIRIMYTEGQITERDVAEYGFSPDAVARFVTLVQTAHSTPNDLMFNATRLLYAHGYRSAGAYNLHDNGTYTLKRFYATNNIVYGWCVCDRLMENAPAYDACQVMLPLKHTPNGDVARSPVLLDSDIDARTLAARLNAYVRSHSMEV